MYEPAAGTHRESTAARAREDARGYRHARYAASLASWGVPRELPRARGWIVERAVPGTDARDARGPYPLFACADWRALAEDVGELAPRLVGLTVVTDPFGAYDVDVLRRAFPDVVRPLKEHFVVDLGRPFAASAHHRRNARRARAAVAIERLDDPARHADEWCDLYASLVQRHAIRGVAAFAREALVAQLHVPGLVAFRAREGARTVGMTLWYVDGAVAYYHLGAYAERGYALRASFALFEDALRALRDVAAWASLGAAAGAHDARDDGLARFKAGWATGTRTAWLCSRVLDPARHAALVAARGAADGGWVPAYRAGEAP